MLIMAHCVGGHQIEVKKHNDHYMVEYSEYYQENREWVLRRYWPATTEYQAAREAEKFFNQITSKESGRC